jgi:hypothetical protein
MGALGREIAQHAGLGMLERKVAGQRRQRIAAIRIRRRCEIGGQKTQLRIALRLIEKLIEQGGEALHSSSS